VTAPALVNQIVRLDELWPSDDVERLHDSLIDRTAAGGLAFLRDVLLARLYLAAPSPSTQWQRITASAASTSHGVFTTPPACLKTVRAHREVSRARLFAALDRRVRMGGRPSEWLR
jgi:hypothetical protein